MNRDIEFRVWDDRYKYMNYKVIVGIYGNWEEVKDNENYTACSMWIDPKNVDYKCEPHWSHFEPYHKEIKLMQYTGLKDKNGKKIFEGDIIKSGNYKTYVQWDNGYCGFLPLCNFISGMDAETCEVIGNIYENKELLGDLNER